MQDKTFVIFFNTTWDWPADYCRQTAEQVSKTNCVFCYLGVEPVSLFALRFKNQKIWEKIHPKLWCYKPIEFPFRRFSWIMMFQQWFNNRLFQLCIHRIIGTEYTIVAWIFDQMYGPFLQYFPRSWKILYDCVDYVWDPDPRLVTQYRKNEETLIHKATWMTVNSRTLAALHAGKRKDITIVPLGFRLEVFQKFRQIQKRRKRQSVTIGFIGVLDYRIDYDLIVELAKRHPEWQIALCGSIHDEYYEKYHISDHIKLSTQRPNITINTVVPARCIPLIISTFDICMIPYRVDIPFNQYCFPMKLFEYFYMGKPVISTPIDELSYYPKFIKIGKSIGQWEDHIKTALFNAWPKEYQKAERRLSIEHSWHRKIETILTHLGGDK